MSNCVKLALLGGDMRQLSVVRELTALGFDVHLWGIDRAFCSVADISPECSWEEAIEDCRVLILPLPVSYDGVRVNCPLLSDFEGVKLSKVLNRLSKDTPVLGGKFSSTVMTMFSEYGVKCLDYFLREELQIKNAVPTAEGAIALAMNELPITLSGAKAAVLGYGRIGKILAHKLKVLDVDVTVAARKYEDLAFAESYGFHGLHLDYSGDVNSLEALTNGYDVIFNTIPFLVLGKTVIDKLSTSTLIIDLASAPGGVDFNAAKARQLKVLQALSLPGKCSPYTAGKIISQTIIQILEEEGIVI